MYTTVRLGLLQFSYLSKLQNFREEKISKYPNHLMVLIYRVVRKKKTSIIKITLNYLGITYTEGMKDNLGILIGLNIINAIISFFYAVIRKT